MPWGLWPGIAVAPATALGAGLDWAVHLAASPAKQLELAQFAFDQAMLAWKTATDDVAVHPLPQDKRFADPAWQAPPYRQLAQRFLLQEQWWQRATEGVPGVTRHHEEMVSFAARQWLDMFAPSNFVPGIAASPDKMLQTDADAKAMLKEANGIPMPNQGLSDAEIAAAAEELYEKLPAVGTAMRWLRRRASSG